MPGGGRGGQRSLRQSRLRPAPPPPGPRSHEQEAPQLGQVRCGGGRRRGQRSAASAHLPAPLQLCCSPATVCFRWPHPSGTRLGAGQHPSCSRRWLPAGTAAAWRAAAAGRFLTASPPPSPPAPPAGTSTAVVMWVPEAADRSAECGCGACPCASFHLPSYITLCHRRRPRPPARLCAQVKRVRCETSAAMVPKDKAIKRFLVGAGGWAGCCVWFLPVFFHVRGGGGGGRCAGSVFLPLFLCISGSQQQVR